MVLPPPNPESPPYLSPLHPSYLSASPQSLPPPSPNSLPSHLLLPTALLLSLSLYLTLRSTNASFKSHFSNWTCPTLQQLFLRISLIPLFYSVFFLLSVLSPSSFYLTEVGIATYECYSIFCYFAFIVLFTGGQEGVVNEINNWITRREFERMLQTLNPNSEGGYRESIGGVVGGGNYLNLDAIESDACANPEEYSYDRVQHIYNKEDHGTNGTNCTSTTPVKTGYYGATVVTPGTPAANRVHDAPVPVPSPAVPLSATAYSLLSSCLPIFSRALSDLRYNAAFLIFSSDPSKHYHRCKYLVIQACFTKPALLLLADVCGDRHTLVNKLLHVGAAVPLIIAMAAIIHLYRILHPLLTSIEAGRKLVVIKLIVVALALQQMTVSGLESAGKFKSVFRVKLYSDSSGHDQAVRFYCCLCIVELGVLAVVLKEVFRPDVFVMLEEKGREIVRGGGISPVLGGSGSEDEENSEANSIEGSEFAMPDVSVGYVDGEGRVRRGGDGEKEAGEARVCCWMGARNARLLGSVLKFWVVLGKEGKEAREGERADKIGRKARFPGDLDRLDSFANDGEVWEV